MSVGTHCLIILLMIVLTADIVKATINSDVKETIVAPVIILGNEIGSSCPSMEQLQNAREAIGRKVMESLPQSIHQCGGGLWRQVAHLNMSDPMERCPSAWREFNSSGVRACGRPSTLVGTCPGTFYSPGTQYSRVCGRIIGYQVGSPAGFYPARHLSSVQFLDGIYVDGVSVTYGSPRSHIWTFSGGTTEGQDQNLIVNCPCVYEPNRSGTVLAPSSIRNNTYCESGNSASDFRHGFLYASDPLWDGQQCEGRCCSDGLSPPWFSVTLPSPTTDDLEVRICGDQDTHDEDTPVSLLELYVQ